MTINKHLRRILIGLLVAVVIALALYVIILILCSVDSIMEFELLIWIFLGIVTIYATGFFLRITHDIHDA